MKVKQRKAEERKISAAEAEKLLPPLPPVLKKYIFVYTRFNLNYSRAVFCNLLFRVFRKSAYRIQSAAIVIIHETGNAR